MSGSSHTWTHSTVHDSRLCSLHTTTSSSNSRSQVNPDRQRCRPPESSSPLASPMPLPHLSPHDPPQSMLGCAMPLPRSQAAPFTKHGSPSPCARPCVQPLHQRFLPHPAAASFTITGTLLRQPPLRDRLNRAPPPLESFSTATPRPSLTPTCALWHGMMSA